MIRGQILTKKLFNNTHFTNFLTLVLDRGVQLAAQLFNIIFIAKYLHHTTFGLYMYAISLYGIVLTITHFGLEKVLVVEYSHASSNLQRQNILLNGFLIKLLACITTYLILKLALNSLSTIISYKTLDVLSVLSIATFFTIWMLIDTYNQYIGQFKNTVYARTLAVLCFLIIKAYIIWQNLGFTFLIYSFIGEQMLCLILALMFSGGFILFLKEIKISNFYIDYKIIKSGSIVLFSAISVLVYFKAAQGMVENELGYKFLGVYSLVISFIEIPIAVASIMSTILTPKLAILLINDHKNISVYSKFLFLFFIAGMLSAFCILLVGLILANYLGAEYQGFYSILLKSIISLPIIFVGYFFGMFLLSSKKMNEYFIITFLGAFFTIIFLFFMKGRVTTNNAVYLYVFSQAIASLIVPLVFQKELRKILLQAINVFSEVNSISEWKTFIIKISRK